MTAAEPLACATAFPGATMLATDGFSDTHVTVSPGIGFPLRSCTTAVNVAVSPNEGSAMVLGDETTRAGACTTWTREVSARPSLRDTTRPTPEALALSTPAVAEMIPGSSDSKVKLASATGTPARS